MGSAQRGFVGAVRGRVMPSPAAVRLPPAAGLTTEDRPVAVGVAAWAGRKLPTRWDSRGGHASTGWIAEGGGSGLPLAVSPLYDRATPVASVTPRRGSTQRGMTGRQRRREAGELAPLGVGSAGGYARAGL